MVKRDVEKVEGIPPSRPFACSRKVPVLGSKQVEQQVELRRVVVLSLVNTLLEVVATKK